jgi:hypothetical protein
MELKQADVDWKWERLKNRNEKLTLTHIPTGKQVSKEVKIGRDGNQQKREVYEDLFDKLEESVYGSRYQAGRKGIVHKDT